MAPAYIKTNKSKYNNKSLSPIASCPDPWPRFTNDKQSHKLIIRVKPFQFVAYSIIPAFMRALHGSYERLHFNVVKMEGYGFAVFWIIRFIAKLYG